jgi:DNA (cytosine-5)-methyltransferase 1
MKVIDLFCGCGGLSSGFELAGHKIAAAYDAWDLAIETYNKNLHSHKAETLDISNVEAVLEKISPLQADAIIGGPPCQDFSSAGSRKEGKRANLTLCYARIVSSYRPRFFVMENVQRSRASGAYAEARRVFKDAGYGVTEIVLDASRCGVPQARKRFFAVGRLGAEDGFLLDILLKNQTENKMTVREYFGEELGIEHYYRHPRTYDRRGIYSIDEPAATIRGVNRPLPEGYKGHSNDSAVLNKNIRPLTTEERSRIQTFPAGFRWAGSKTDVEQMIGNAVPVNLARYVGECLNQYQQSTATPEAA